MKLFEVGDRVFDLRFGFGNVVKIDEAKTWSIFVDFDRNLGEDEYTKQGCSYTNENRSLWHADLVEFKKYVAGLNGE